MDAKASAKSKRAHSLHGNRKWSTHANPSAKNASQSASTSNKNPSRERNHRSRAAPTLPSNWDRYHEDEVESDQENRSVDIDESGRASAYVAAPKSKGADFKELITQAQTGSRAYSRSSLDDVSSSGVVLHDFYQGMSSMLSIRGKSLLSWCADDNFDMDENATSGYETSFLSMDLHALAAQLEKIDVSKRLFIKPDLLSPGLRADAPKESSNQKGSLATLASHGEYVVNEKKLNNLNEVTPSTVNSISSSEAGGLETRDETSDSSSFFTIAEQVVKAEPFKQGGSEESTFASNLDAATDLKGKDYRLEAAAAAAEAGFPSTATSISGSDTGGLETRDETSESSSFFTVAEQIVKAEPFKQGVFEESMLTSNLDGATDLKGKGYRFEAAAAEVELDILLNSFGEAEFFDSGSSVMKPSNGFPAVEGDLSISTKEPIPIAATQPIVQIPGSSRQTYASVALDDAIDDLLGETSISFNQKNEPLSQSHAAMPVSLPPQSSSYSGSQALDDFDSWMDSL